ncbi:hypothetical protein JCM10212_005206 [Sporobolomyces blumeae]
MHFYVRDLSGRSLAFADLGSGLDRLVTFPPPSFSTDASNVSDLQYAVADRTAIPVEEQRLVYGSRQLVAGGQLADYGVREGSTIGLALRLRGGAPKKRCGFYLTATDRCSQAAVRIVGDCNLCSTSFCSTHRLSEDHKCPNLASCKQAAFQQNKSKLESERTVGDKLASF